MPKLVINPIALWKTIWNMFILLLILFMGVTVPYRIPFEDKTSKEWLNLDIVCDFMFIVDLAFNLLTAYEDENGELIVKKQKIAMNYLKGWFMLDMVSSVPITLIQEYTGGSGLENVKLLKLSRLPRLYRLIRLVKLTKLYKQNSFLERLFQQINLSLTAKSMMTSLVMMVFLLHLIGCLWATVASLTTGSYPTTWMNFIDVEDRENYD